MGIYLNPGLLPFQMAVNSQIYVDKTGLIDELNKLINTEQRFICVSRPRRFGKSMTANMLSAYYDRTVHSDKLFAKYQIASRSSFRKYLNKFDVIHINILDFLTRDGDTGKELGKMQSFLIDEIKMQYPDLHPYDPTSLSLTMAEAFRISGHQFVIILDEWDCLFRMRSEKSRTEREQDQQKYLDFLREWLKDRTYISLAYMTGILPIRKYGDHSALNMFFEYSMTSPFQFAPYTGFTGEEVRSLCREYHADYAELQKWYDGYIADRTTSSPEQRFQIYCPLSVVNAILTRSIKNYWNQTESYLALKENINRNYDGLHEIVAMLMKGARQKINIDTYQNDMETFHGSDDVLTMLVHLGYLSYDPKTNEVFIPNKELMSVFQSSVRNDQKWDVLFEIMNHSQQLLEATWNKDGDAVAKWLEKSHEKAGNLTYNNEAALSYAIRLAYFNAEQYYTLIPEMQAGRGYADLVYIPTANYPNKPAMIIELKYDQDADTAIQQIHRQHYPESLKKYKGNLLLVGINYTKNLPNHHPDYKHHTCVIENA